MKELYNPLKNNLDEMLQNLQINQQIDLRWIQKTAISCALIGFPIKSTNTDD